MKQRILNALRQQEDFLCALATIGLDGQPRVRFMKGIIDGDLVIRCPTFLSTHKVQEIGEGCQVSLTCGDTSTHRPGSYFQIQGQATIHQDTSERMKAWAPRLEKWFRGIEDPNYAVVRIEPSQIIALPVGGGPPTEFWER